MASIEMVRPRGGADGYARLTSASSRAEDASSAAPVARPARSLWTRLGDVADETLPRPPRGGNPADRRRVWRWATVSAVLCAVMFALVASNDPARGLREASPDDASPADASPASTSDVVRPAPLSPRRLRASPDACARERHLVPAHVEVEPPAPVEGTPDGWRRFASELARDAATNGTDATLILLGDSIFELFRGTSVGRPRREYSTAPAALAARLGDHHPVTLAVAGDTTANLLWRLANGGFVGAASGSKKTASPYVVVMIGANDLGAAARAFEEDRAGRVATHVSRGKDATCLSEQRADALLRAAPRVAAGVVAVADRARRLKPSSRIVALGLPPRGDWIVRDGTPTVSYEQPSTWTAAIEEINRRARAYAEGPGLEAARATGGVVAFQPCEDGFLEKEDGAGERRERRIAKNRMRDGLHPSEGGGFEALVECIVAGMARADEIAEKEV